MATSITNTSVTTDDLTIDTNVLKVDSANNRVGIGTSTPLSTVHHDVGLTSRDGYKLFYGTDPKAAFTVHPNTGEIRIGAATAGTGGNYYTEIMSRNGSNLVTSIKADTNGHVTMPNQPAFMAFKVGNQSVGTSVVQVTGWNNNLDIGSNWDNSQNRYTVPTAGIYLAGGFYQANQSTGLHFGIYKNGSAYGNDSLLDMVAGAANGYSVPFAMAANDYFTWVSYCSATSNINANRSKIWVIKVA